MITLSVHWTCSLFSEGLWRMRRHGPGIVQCTDCVVFPLMMMNYYDMID